MAESLLLDTCALIWIANGDPISDAVADVIRTAESEWEPIYVSPISAWEVATLSAKGRLRLTSAPEAWFARAMSAPTARLTELSATILVRSAFLPSAFPGDPADRIIVATARERDLTIVTRDGRILDYAREGLVRAMRC